MVKKALVTGCCGFIGSALFRHLILKGWDVEGVDDLSVGSLDSVYDANIRPVPADFLHVFESKDPDMSDQSLVINGDFTHEAVLSRIKSGRYDIVFHLAAISSVPHSVEFPVETYETNVFKTIALFDACKENVKKVIFASSASVYGDTERLPIRESQPPFPQSPYALQKLQCEQYAELSSKLYDTDIISLRLFNVFGPGQKSGVIAEWCNNIRLSKPILVTGDGNQTRDFCYIDNVVDAFVETSLRGPCGLIYNIGTGVCISINDIVGHLKKACSGVIVEYANSRQGDVKHSQADITRINKELNINPRVQFLHGLNETLKWWGLNEN